MFFRSTFIVSVLLLPCVLPLSPIHPLYALGYYPALGTLSSGTGGSGLMHTDVFSAANNTALMPLLKKPAIGGSITSVPGYGNSLQSGYCFVMPLKHIAYGLQLRSYGNGTLQDQTLGTSAAHALNNRLSFGIGANYHKYSIVNYGRVHVFSLDMSIVSKLSGKLTTAVSLFNPFAASIGPEKLDRVMHIGAKYDFNKAVLVVAELEKAFSSPVNFKTGINYQFIPGMYCSGGYSSIGGLATFGLGYRHKRINAGFAMAVPAAGPLFTNFSFAYELGK